MAVLMLYMMTLGQVIETMESEGLNIQLYLLKYSVKIINDYPIIFGLIRGILEAATPDFRADS